MSPLSVSIFLLSKFCSLMIFVFFVKLIWGTEWKKLTLLRLPGWLLKNPSPPVPLGGLLFHPRRGETFFLGGQRLTEHRWEHHESSTTIFAVKDHCAEEVGVLHGWKFNKQLDMHLESPIWIQRCLMVLGIAMNFLNLPVKCVNCQSSLAIWNSDLRFR